MARTTGWTAPPGRASGGPCGTDTRCGVLGAVTLPTVAWGGRHLAPGI